MRRIAPILALTVAVFPALARAQVAEPSTCTTTTTVHCTGAAAPYAVPPVAQPVYPPPAVYLPPPAYPAPPPVVLDLRELEHDGWHLVQHEDGSFSRERKTSTASPALWGTGLTLLAGGWLAAGGYSVYDSNNGLPGVGFIPVLGSWMQAAAIATGDNNRPGVTAFYALDGLVQAGGFVMFLVGLSAGPAKIEHMPVMVSGGATPGGGGVSLTGRF